jgi:hypothetical protein
MTSRRWGMLVPSLVFSLTLATAGSARAQCAFQSIADHPSISQFGPAYDAGITCGISPFDFVSTGCGSCGGYGVFEVFPDPGYGTAAGQWPGTTASYRFVSDIVTAVPGRRASKHRARRRRTPSPTTGPEHESVVSRSDR